MPNTTKCILTSGWCLNEAEEENTNRRLQQYRTKLENRTVKTVSHRGWIEEVADILDRQEIQTSVHRRFYSFMDTNTCCANAREYGFPNGH